MFEFWNRVIQLEDHDRSEAWIDYMSDQWYHEEVFTDLSPRHPAVMIGVRRAGLVFLISAYARWHSDKVQQILIQHEE